MCTCMYAWVCFNLHVCTNYVYYKYNTLCSVLLFLIKSCFSVHKLSDLLLACFLVSEFVYCNIMLNSLFFAT